MKVLDQAGREVPTGKTGRIFVGNRVQFEGYTGGGTKEIIGGLMCSGDVGHFDYAGRLFVDGRDDDMIVSGGENLFPARSKKPWPTIPTSSRRRSSESPMSNTGSGSGASSRCGPERR